jgi:Z1 domain
MSSNYERLSSTVRATLATDEQPTRESIRTRVEQFRKLPGFDVSDHEAAQLCRDIEASLDISMPLGPVIQEDFTEWLNAAKAGIQPYYWERYRQLLQQQQFPSRVMSRLDEVTDRILGLLQNPEEPGPWDRRGMVVGHVQSGKTANYTGLICKAADAGYRLIIVIAGIHNNLRNQTQARIDEGFVGRDSSGLLNDSKARIIGAGRYGATEFPLTVTNTRQDFNKSTATTLGVQLRSLKVPAILVIKKNASTLKHLNDWLRTHNAQGASNLVDAPMLLIDDEADNASIDISRDPESASTINRLIRQLLAMFNRSCYVGYTATPFANIFIDPNSEHEMYNADLFPRDFIVSLSPPTNYFGATRIFGDSVTNNIVRDIDDNEDLLPIKHKNFHEITQLPASLLDAVRSFVLVRAIRILRGQATAHNSMLVNASRFTSVQTEIRDHLHDFMDNLERRIRFEKTGDPRKALADEVIKALHDAWQREFSALEFSWPDIFRILLETVAPITVIEINSKSASSLDYEAHRENGKQVIAVGGFSLSRGLTLEGLTVSYFLRNSMMYDTLMQMGRWFGYRPDYEDLCRIWMTPDASGWYEHITESIEELRAELRAMERAKLTPKEFGLKVRSHPDTLIVTARNKMGTAESYRVRIGLANEFIETYAIPGKPGKLLANSECTRKLIDQISADKSTHRSDEKGSILWRNVSAERIVEFLAAWHNQPESLQTDTGPVAEYISRRIPNELTDWDVVLVGLQNGAGDGDLSSALGPPVRCQHRTVSSKTTEDCIFLSRRNRVASRGAEKIGLSETAKKRAVDRWIAEAQQDKKNVANVPDRAYRAERERPLLLLHLLKLEEPTRKDGVKVNLPRSPVVAWGISFPKSSADDPTVEYVVNTTWMKAAFASDIDEDEVYDTDAD